MKFSLTKLQFIGYFIPGFIFLLIIFCSYKKWELNTIFASVASDNKKSITIGLIIFIMAFFTGLVIDALRNAIIEEWLNKIKTKTKQKEEKSKIKRYFIYWKYFSIPDDEKNKIEHLYDKYYTWYVFDINACIGLMVALIISWIIYFNQCRCEINFNICRILFATAIIIIALTLLFIDALSLREEISDITNDRIEKQ